jgi:hypothetical protein
MNRFRSDIPKGVIRRSGLHPRRHINCTNCAFADLPVRPVQADEYPAVCRRNPKAEILSDPENHVCAEIMFVGASQRYYFYKKPRP